MTSATAIGIDLGTTNSLVAYLHKGNAELIQNDQGFYITPSQVTFDNDGVPIVGQFSETKIRPANEIFAIKRIIGRTFPQAANDISKLPFKVIQDSSLRPIIEIPINLNQSKLHKTPQEISALILEKLNEAGRQRIESGYESKAVITVPAYFNNSQRVATRLAATQAGITVLALINEPTAAAIAHMYNNIANKEKITDKTILVYDFGGGTFDVSIIQVVKGRTLRVLGIDGDCYLGGTDVDNILVNMALKQLKEMHNIELDHNNNEKHAKDYRRIIYECTKMKHALSLHPQYEFQLAPLQKIEEFVFDYTQEEYDKAIQPLIDRTIKTIESCLKKCSTTADKIDQVLIVGGSSRIPLVKKSLRAFFGPNINLIENDDDLEKIVAKGAAIYAAKLNNPGLNEYLEEFKLNDVLSFSLGIQVRFGEMCKILEKNATLPASHSIIIKTTKDNQEEISMPIFEGEDSKVINNRKLGDFTVDDLQPAPKGSEKVDVKFEADIDGILHIEAVNLRTNVCKELIINLA